MSSISLRCGPSAAATSSATSLPLILLIIVFILVRSLLIISIVTSSIWRRSQPNQLPQLRHQAGQAASCSRSARGTSNATASATSPGKASATATVAVVSSLRAAQMPLEGTVGAPQGFQQRLISSDASRIIGVIVLAVTSGDGRYCLMGAHSASRSW